MVTWWEAEWLCERKEVVVAAGCWLVIAAPGTAAYVHPYLRIYASSRVASVGVRKC